MNRTLRWQGITLGTLFLGYAGYYVCRSNLSLATPLIVDDLGDQGITREKIGAIVSLGVGFYAVGKVTNGLLTDFLGGRRLFLLGMAVSVLCTVFFGLGSGLVVFATAWVANRYFQSAGWGALVKLASRWYPVRWHSTIMAVLCLSYLFGDALGRVYLGLFLRQHVGWRGLFFIAAGTLGVIALITWFFLKESPQSVGAEEPAGNPDNLFAKAGDAAQPDSLAGLLHTLLTNGTFWLVCVMNWGLTLIRETFNFWTPSYLKEAVHMGAGTAGIASAVFPFVGGFSVLLAGILSDRLRGKHGRIVFPALVILTGMLWLLGSASTGANAGVTLLLISTVSFFLLGPYSFCSGVMALDLGGKRGSSTAAGLIDGAGYLGAILSGYGVSWLANRYGWPVTFEALAGVAGLTAVAALVYWIQQEMTPSRRDFPTPIPEKHMEPPIIERIIRLFKEHGDASYIGEPVSQTEHALQAAWAAEKAGATSALIAATLLHDVGHLLHHLPEDCAEQGIDDKHEELGARWLTRFFGPEVTEPIRLHVPAKRYLCAREPGYLEKLSDASRLSLKLQGGAMTPSEADDFLNCTHARAAITLRLWDEEAKIEGLQTPALEHFRQHLEQALTPVR